MSFRQYRSYSHSGADHLGEVPDHWAVRPLKHLVTLSSGGTPSKERQDFWNGDIPWASAKDLKSEQLHDTADHITDAAVDEGGVQIAPAGAVLVLVRGMMLARTFPVCVATQPMAINQDLKALMSRPGMRNDYMAWLLRGTARATLDRLDEAGHGTKALRMDSWTSMKLPVPPASEQLAITTFLHRETAKIDALVEEQRRLIELLREKRQAVISHAVTKGLAPSAPMKDSGVSWLGVVPAHWKVTPLMRLTAPGRDVMYGIVLPGPNVGAGVPIVKGGDVKEHRLRLSLLNWTTPEIEAPFARARLLPGDIVYSIRGSIGDAEPVPEELRDANITQDVARISPGPDTDGRWLLHAMRSVPVFVQLEQGSLGAAVRGINIFDLKRARIPVPPRAEQGEIAAYLDGELARLARLSSEASAAVALLTERRAALISAAVTGKIDVREPTAAHADLELA